MGGYFAVIMPANTIRDRKKPTLITSCTVPGKSVAQKILIVFADLAYVGQLRELKLEHTAPGKGLAASKRTGALRFVPL